MFVCVFATIIFGKKIERVYVKLGMNVMALEANLSSASEKIIFTVTVQSCEVRVILASFNVGCWNIVFQYFSAKCILLRLFPCRTC
jgi:hypothetical protein